MAKKITQEDICKKTYLLLEARQTEMSAQKIAEELGLPLRSVGRALSMLGHKFGLDSVRRWSQAARTYLVNYSIKDPTVKVEIKFAEEEPEAVDYTALEKKAIAKEVAERREKMLRDFRLNRLREGRRYG